MSPEAPQITYDADQQSAIADAVNAPFLIVTGGAGTGKTTIIAEIANRKVKLGQQVKLCAFAGKAAARLREACRFPASTIHRLLEYNGKGFRRHHLHGVHIVMDESSMVSTELMSAIMGREPESITLVGDPAQLPPVGTGQPFHDLIKLRPSFVRHLSTCYRATEAVYKAANAIRHGGFPMMSDRTANETWRIMNTGDATRTQEQILQWVRKGHIDFDQDIILCPKNGDKDTAATVRGLNAAIVKIIRPRDDDVKLVPGDRVINGKNNPDLDIWNGTTGVVHSIDIDKSVWFKPDVPVIDWNRTTDELDPVYTDTVNMTRTQAKELSLAYALTVHKSQGSQYRRVMFVALSRDSYALLSRSLIYTAVTRTVESCVVCGQVAALRAGIGKIVTKNTVIQELAQQGA